MAKDTLKAKCPACGKSFRFDADLAGKLGRCGSCKQKFTLPNAEDVRAPASASSGKSAKKTKRSSGMRKGTASKAPAAKGRKSTGRVGRVGKDSGREGGREGGRGRQGRRKKKGPNPLIIIAGGAVLIAGLFGLIYVLSKQDPNKVPAKKSAKKKAGAKNDGPPATKAEMEAFLKEGMKEVGNQMQAMEAKVKAAAAKGEAGIPELAGFLEEESLIAFAAAGELVKFGAKAVPEVAKRLENPKADVRKAALLVLGKIGKDASSVREKIEELAENDPDPKIKEFATQALERI